ncbi:MAG: DUF6090 family protein [Pseudomonadota bacterium]
MILRRITQHVKDQNWTAVGLDFVIVVVGVFIGIQVANWNDDRTDRGEEIQYLRALQTDVDASLMELEDQLNFLERQGEAQRTLVEYSAGDRDDLSAEMIDKLVHVGVYELYPLSPQQAAFEELKSSGKLSLLQSVELRNKLQEMEAAFAVVQEWQRDVNEIYYRFSDPFLIENYAVRNVVRNEPTRVGFPSTPWLNSSEVLNEISPALKSQRFQNVVLYRGNIGAGLRASTHALRPLYEDIDALIAERLIALGEMP